MSDAAHAFVTDEQGESFQVTAVLYNAEWHENLGWRFIVGRMYNDRLQRYADGQTVNVSYISRQLQEDVFLTRGGNVYIVKSWARRPLP